MPRTEAPKNNESKTPEQIKDAVNILLASPAVSSFSVADFNTVNGKPTPAQTFSYDHPNRYGKPSVVCVLTNDGLELQVEEPEDISSSPRVGQEQKPKPTNILSLMRADETATVSAEQIPFGDGQMVLRALTVRTGSKMIVLSTIGTKDD